MTQQMSRQTRFKRARAPVRLAVAGLTLSLMSFGLTPSSMAQAKASIAFLSPTALADEDPVISDKSAANGTYRLSAWVRNAPTQAVVEFELVGDGTLSQGMNLGAAKSVSPDTYEMEWDIPDGTTGVLNGEYVLRAILYDLSTSQEIASTSQTVMIMHGATQAQGTDSVDISYPVAGGPFGMNTLGSAATGTVEIKQSATHAADTYYSVSAPGSPPEWIQCKDGESSADQADGIRCTLRSDNPATKNVNETHRASAVTALAAALVDQSGNTLATDATRVVPYAQRATQLGIKLISMKPTDPANSAGTPRQDRDASGAFPCSDRVTVTATDQLQRPIPGMNVDIHATGPSDQLKFDTGWLSAPSGSPRLQPPDKGHVSVESGFRCTSTHDSTGSQGDHGAVGASDPKHVESTSGTNDGGALSFRLRTDQTGATQVTAWVDTIDDDVLCDVEAQAMASIALSWGQETPAAVPMSPQNCSQRSLTLRASTDAIAAGEQVSFAGTVVSQNASCVDNELVTLRAKRRAASSFRTIAKARTNTSGVFTFNVRPKRTLRYKAVAPPAAACLKATSPTLIVRVKR